MGPAPLQALGKPHRRPARCVTKLAGAHDETDLAAARITGALVHYEASEHSPPNTCRRQNTYGALPVFKGTSRGNTTSPST